MNHIALLLAATLVLVAGGLVTWVWFVMVQVEDDLRSIGGLEGLRRET